MAVEMMDQFILIETPRALWSEVTGGPIERCTVCSRPLLDKGIEHLVEKAFRRGELLYEFGMCTGCLEWLDASLSVASSWMRDDWLMRQVNFFERFQTLAHQAPDEIDPWISACVIKGTPVPELDEYQVQAACCGTDVVLCDLPYTLSGESMDELHALFSRDSCRQLDDFARNYLGLPPALMRSGDVQAALAD